MHIIQTNISKDQNREMSIRAKQDKILLDIFISLGTSCAFVESEDSEWIFIAIMTPIDFETLKEIIGFLRDCQLIA